MSTKHPRETVIFSDTRNSFEKINAFDLNVYLPGQLLTKVDRTGMMHSLEVRSPFLDTALVEFVYNLPCEFKLSKTGNKIILKEILAEIFPADFVYRKKQGFGAPLLQWLTESGVKNELQRIAHDSNHPLYRYLSQDTVRTIIDNSATYDKKTVQKVWSLLSLALWLELHKTEYE